MKKNQHIEQINKKGFKKHIILDRDEIRKSKDAIDKIQEQLDDPELIKKHGKCTIEFVMTHDQFQVATDEIAQVHGDILGNIEKNKSKQADILGEYVNSKSGHKTIWDQ